MIPSGATEDAVTSTMASRRLATAVSEFPCNNMSNTLVDPAGGTIAAVHNELAQPGQEQVIDQVSYALTS